MTIGVDHGYAAMKTAHFSFPTGLVEYEHEPYTRRNVLEYDGRYFVVGTGRQPLQKDKTVTEDYYLLTLAAIAKELEHRQAVSAISKCRFSPKLNVVFYGAAYRCYTALYTTSLAGLKPVKPWFISLFQA